MNIQFFKRLHYKSFACVSLDTKKWRYWYNLSYPFYLLWFPQEQVDDKFHTEEEKIELKKQEHSIGTKYISFQWLIEAICHTIIHIKCCIIGIKRDKYWAAIEPEKYGKYDKWYKKLFSKKYFNEHQNRYMNI